MTDAIKVLGQSAPAATTETALYTVPAATSTVVSSLTVCNRDAGPSTFRISVSVGGGVTASKDYLYYNLTVAAGDTFAATLGLTLSATDVVRVYASTANVSFNLFGLERT